LGGMALGRVGCGGRRGLRLCRGRWCLGRFWGGVSVAVAIPVISVVFLHFFTSTP
jgi:hypothetical protein